MSGHILVVPTDIDRPMEVEHPKTCLQCGQLDLVRTVEGDVACPMEQIARRGLEIYFHRSELPDPFFPGTEYAAPGRHLVVVDAEDGLALHDTAASDAA